MSETTTTTTDRSLDRGDILAWLDARLGDATQQAARDQGLPPDVARAIRLGAVRRLGDSIIDAKRIAGALTAHDKG